MNTPPLATVVPSPPAVLLDVTGKERKFPARRVYCVGRNYAAHAREMGSDPEREPPFFFSKPADALIQNGPVHYPPRTANLHHEIELVAAIGRAGSDIAPGEAGDHVYGYAIGIDLTRRDLQSQAKNSGRPWVTAKGFDESAPIGSLHPVETHGHPTNGTIRLELNGETRQEGDLADLIWTVPEVVAELSTLFRLEAGDLIFTGTPAGVGPVEVGDVLLGQIEGLGTLETRILPARTTP